MTDWTDANYTIGTHALITPNTGPENGNYNYVWRSQWPQHDNDYTWTYFLNNNTDIVGFVMNDPLEGNIGNLVEPNDVRYYITNGWPSNIPFSGLKQPIAEMGTVLTHDDVTTGKHNDWVFPGPGNDRVSAANGNDVVAGGSGDDIIFGADGADTLYGDWNDAPIVKDEDFKNQVFKWALPTKADPDVVDGNDQLNGGPRGNGYTDILTGGGGADAFYLSYKDDNTDSGGDGFWSAYGEAYVAGVGGSVVQNGVQAMTASAAADFFGSLAGSMLTGGLSTAIGNAASDGIELLLGMDKSATPKPNGEDVMVVTDFDPREDVLFLPVPTADQNDPATTLTATPTYYSESASGANGQTGWGIEFAKGTGDTVFAEVFLGQKFLDAFGITENSEFADDFIHDVFDNALVIDENGVVDQASAYPFPTDASAYADGVVPEVADDPIAFAAPSGTTTKVFGAFGGLSFVAPTATTTGVYVAGTHQGDILNVNPASFDLAKATASGNLTSETSHVMGFDGDDIIFGGNGIDVIQGGDGDDWIYGIGHEGVETVETFSGDDGDDLIYLGWTSMSALVDGGDGTDTASFVYVNGTVTADLSTVTTDPLSTPNATSTNKADSLISNYALTDIENLAGTANDDKLTGDTGDNIIQGNAGNDTLAGGGGTDTASYRDNAGKVAVNLAKGNAAEYDAAGSTVVSSDTLAGFEAAFGSDFDDTLTGGEGDDILAGGAGNDNLDGGPGTNTLSYMINSGSVSVDLLDGTTEENGPTGGSSAGTPVSEDTFSNFQRFVGTPFDDQWRSTPAGDYEIDGGAGVDILRFGAVDNGVKVDVSTGVIADNGYGKQATIANVEQIDGTDFNDSLTGDANANRLRGLSGDDILIGGDGDDNIITDDGQDKVTPGAGADSVNLTQSATQESDYESNMVSGKLSEWSNDTIEYMGYTDFLVVEGSSEKAELTTKSANELDVKLDSSSAFEIRDPVFGTSTSDIVQQFSGGNLVLSYKGASLDSDAVAAHFTSPTPVTGGSTATEVNDLLVGSSKNDRLSGRAGDDVLHGLAGADVLTGDNGDDALLGGDGNDWLYAGAGNDIIVSGPGIADVAYGQSGADTHVFGDELANGIRETDIIQDYDPLEDLIDLGGSELVAHVKSTDSVALWVGTDLDVVIVNGATSLDSIAFTEGTLTQETVA